MATINNRPPQRRVIETVDSALRCFLSGTGLD
jgi:hypothetical protein